MKTIELNYQSAPSSRRMTDVGALVLQTMAAYFVVSIVTLPFLDSIWIGELPLLALVQVPKVFVAGWIRTDVMMPVIRMLGLSRGSFSPDYIMARPYALALAYGLVFGLVLGMLRMSKRFTPAARRWAYVALAAAAIDFALTLWLAGGLGLTVY